MYFIEIAFYHDLNAHIDLAVLVYTFIFDELKCFIFFNVNYIGTFSSLLFCSWYMVNNLSGVFVLVCIIFYCKDASKHDLIPFMKIKTLDEQRILLEEEAWLNMSSGCLHIKSRNLTWATYADMREESFFTPHVDNQKWWVYKLMFSMTF